MSRVCLDSYASDRNAETELVIIGLMPPSTDRGMSMATRIPNFRRENKDGVATERLSLPTEANSTQDYSDMDSSVGY